MQLCNAEVRHGGSLTSTVFKRDITPAEILILQRIHGGDAVVNIRPTKFDKTLRQETVWEKLATDYDRAAALNAPGDASKSIMVEMFPGAMRKLPTTLAEIGLGNLMPPEKRGAKAAAQSEPVETEEERQVVDDDDGVPVVDEEVSS